MREKDSACLMKFHTCFPDAIVPRAQRGAMAFLLPQSRRLPFLPGNLQRSPHLLNYLMMKTVCVGKLSDNPVQPAASNSIHFYD